MKKIVTVFTVFALLTLMGCKKCIEYDEQLSHSPIRVGKTMIMRTYHKCLKYEE